jgi:hypothetical protein
VGDAYVIAGECLAPDKTLFARGLRPSGLRRDHDDGGHRTDATPNTADSLRVTGLPFNIRKTYRCLQAMRPPGGVKRNRGRLEGQRLMNGPFRDPDLGRGLHAFEDAAEPALRSTSPQTPQAVTRSAAKTRNRRPIPPPPPLEAVVLTLDEAAGLLRLRRRSSDQLRRSDPTFGALVMLIGGQPRIRRAALDRWLDGRPVGAWSPMGGTRERAFGRLDASRR